MEGKYYLNLFKYNNINAFIIEDATELPPFLPMLVICGILAFGEFYF